MPAGEASQGDVVEVGKAKLTARCLSEERERVR